MFSWTDLLPVAGAALGASQANKGGQTQTSTQLDPRMASYIYGQDGKGGLLADANSIYQQQMQNGGLNDMQREGLDMQAQYLRSPQYSGLMNTFMNQGQGLLNRPSAGNPFTRSQQGSQAPSMPSGGYQYKPSQVQAPVYRPAQQPQTALQASQPSANLGIGERSGQGGGNVSGGSLLGTGRMTDAINDSAMGTFKQYLGLGLTPAAAAALVQKTMATSQTLDAVNASDDPIGMLNSIQGWTDTEDGPAYEGRGSRNGGTSTGYGNMGNGGYGGATGGYGGSYGSGSVGGFR